MTPKGGRDVGVPDGRVACTRNTIVPVFPGRHTEFQGVRRRRSTGHRENREVVTEESRMSLRKKVRGFRFFHLH